LLDLPDAWTAWSFAALKHSDLIVLVTQLSVAGIRQAKRQLDTLEAQGLGDVPINIVLNRFKKGWEETITVDEAQNALGRGISFRIVNDYKVVNEALNQGRAVGKIKKRSKVEKSIRALVEGTIEQLAAGKR
jgi:Flp pilus assembly CpaE family ATPase